MEAFNLSPLALVADLLAASPLVAPLFVALRVDCAGCSMTKFCTLADLCRHYGLEFASLSASLGQTIRNQP